MQIFSAYKKVERGGVRTLAFLHSFACFFYLFIFYLRCITVCTTNLPFCLDFYSIELGKYSHFMYSTVVSTGKVL